LKSFYGDSVQDVVGGLGPDERVLAVAENAAQAALNGQPTAVPKNADGTAEDDPLDQSGPGCRRAWSNAPGRHARLSRFLCLRVFIALLTTHKVCAFYRNWATQLVEWAGRTDEDDVQ
jgi:hypothetical protein